MHPGAERIEGKMGGASVVIITTPKKVDPSLFVDAILLVIEMSRQTPIFCLELCTHVQMYLAWYAFVCNNSNEQIFQEISQCSPTWSEK